ncbi:hypothetical protein GCM10022225_16070 [Plantactinospora mayteni]|uniref:YbaB/EbfC family DNA-binding protein n=1 Tax=Plantactinospora mayteni TaxID=566021 RepID=A0ABQ4EG34_9ACTN|nr:hypothetical protein [Plantactinospora mayteni]GIG93681.1 hypothetical protein Pma05_02540 [Plantactinospora mayteni]
MADNFPPELREIAQDLAWVEMTAAAIRATAPGRVETTDRSGTVRLVLGPDGLPESIDVGQDWQRTLGSESIGAAVTEAGRAAVEKRAEHWSEALDERTKSETGESTGTPDELEPYADALRQSVNSMMESAARITPRPLDAVLREFNDVLSEPFDPADMEPPQGTGVTGFGKLTLTLRSDGTLSCAVDPHWAAELSAEELTEELNRALASARAELPDGIAAPTAATVRLQALTAELLAMIRPT